MIRKAYFEHPDYIPLLHRSYELWRELEGESGEQLFAQCGLVLYGHPDSATIRGLDACYARNDLPHERLRYEEALRRYPQYSVPRDYVAYHDPEGGFLFVEKGVQHHLAGAQRYGADMLLDSAAVSWSAEGDGVTVTTDKATLHADRLVLTLGPWSGELSAELGIPLKVLRKVQLWYTSADLEEYRLPRFLPFYIDTGQGAFYGFPDVGGSGLKIAEHSGGTVVSDPEEVSRELSDEDETGVLRFMEATFPDFRPTLRRFAVCLYTMTPDGNFVVDQHPQHGSVVIACGFSGHGFKFASVIGEVLADLAMRGETAHAVEFLRLERFKNTRQPVVQGATESR